MFSFVVVLYRQTTRIRNVLSEGTEIELGRSSRVAVICDSFLYFAELLGVQESVALLAAVAQLDSDLVPPVCLEIGSRFSVSLLVYLFFVVFRSLPLREIATLLEHRRVRSHALSDACHK